MIVRNRKNGKEYDVGNLQSAVSMVFPDFLLPKERTVREKEVQNFHKRNYSFRHRKELNEYARKRRASLSPEEEKRHKKCHQKSARKLKERVKETRIIINTKSGEKLLPMNTWIWHKYFKGETPEQIVRHYQDGK